MSDTRLNAFLHPELQDNVMARMRQAMMPQVEPPGYDSIPLTPNQQGPGPAQMGPPVPSAAQTSTNAMVAQPTPSSVTPHVLPSGHFSSDQWHMPIAHASAITGTPVSVIDSVMGRESTWNPNARSPVGAIGLMQLMPDTARGLGVDPHDPQQNIMGGAKYLAQLHRQFNSWPLAIAAYNAGPGAVQRHGGIPPYHETQNYVKNVLADITAKYGGIK